MGMPQMGMPQMGMPQMGMPQMGMPQMMGANNDIDSLMVNTLVPVNNSSMNSNGLMNPSQMVNNLSNLHSSQTSNHMNQQVNTGFSLKNLSKLNM
jgi:hypothetical protein